MTGEPITRDDVRRAAGALYDESEFALWFSSPQALLCGRAPAELVAIGRGDEVMRLIAQIEQGAFL
jgi:hypothetical protein